MKCKLFIDKDTPQERVEIYAREITREVEEIKSFSESFETSIVGYTDENTVKLSLAEIYCFTVEDSKVFALTKEKKYRLKLRLYQIEAMLTEDFLKLNQSCIGASSKILRFEVPFSGALNVVFKNGHRDYVSRRNLKAVKERFLK